MKDYLTEDDADTDVTAATKEISSQISKRFGEIKNNETYILATALDPRYKAQLFSDETKDELKDLLKENYPLRYADDHERSPQQYQEFDTLDKTEEAGTITLFSVTKKLLLSKNKSDEHSTGTTSKNKNIDRDIENEISVYLHERTEPLESDLEKGNKIPSFKETSSILPSYSSWFCIFRTNIFGNRLYCNE
jgi:hypothetical protein